MNYFQHNDSYKQIERIHLQNAQAERARMLATFEESYSGNITLYMDRWTARRVLLQAHIIQSHGKVPALGTAMSKLMISG